jgi:hypothetical protein
MAPAQVHFVGHLLTIASLAWAAALFFGIVRAFCGFPSALAWTLAAVATPVFAGQAAALGQDPICAAILMQSLYFFFRNRPGWALGTAGFACTAKITALILLPVYAGYYFIAAWADRSDRRRRLIIAAAATVLTLAIYLLYKRFNPIGEAGAGIFNLGPILIWRHFKYFFPILFPVMAAGTVLLFRQIRRETLKKFLLSPKGEFDRKKILLPVLLVWGFFAAYFLFSAPQLPRYAVIVVLPLMIYVAYAAEQSFGARAVPAALVLFGINLCSLQGLLFAPLPPYYAADPSQLERSREFLNVIEADRRICRQIETEYSDIPIVCKWPHVQMLTVPEFGYVEKPLPNIINFGLFPKYAPARKFDPAGLPADLLWLYAPNSNDLMFGPSFMPRPGIEPVAEALNPATGELNALLFRIPPGIRP